MIRLSLIVTCLAISMMSIGCCAPMGCNSCGIGGCGSDGTIVRGGLAGGPLDGLRQMKRNMTCGNGCGETYFGEWRSTPPDCQDPCCGDQWVGGAVKARPFSGHRLACWQPGALLGSLYGGRYCCGAESSVPCGCGVDLCDGGCGTGGYVEGEIISSGGSSSTGNCGCASCSAGGAVGSGVRMANGIPASDGITRSASTRYMDHQDNRIRR